MSVKPLSDRPAKVVLAMKLFYSIVGIGIIRAVMTVVRHADVRSPYFFIFTKLLIYTCSLYLIYQLGKGRNWAKVSLVAIFAINIPLTILPSLESLSHNPVHTLLGFLQIALYVAALVFLFHRSSASWFGAGNLFRRHRRP